MLYLNRNNELCECSKHDFKMFVNAKNVKKMTLTSNENGFIKMWQDRIREIEQTGNCMNGNVHNQMPYFGEKVPKERKIAFCENMIYRLEKRELQKKNLI